MAVPSTSRQYVPHFEVASVDGGRVRYRDIWQRRNLVLVIAAGHHDAAVRYAEQLRVSGREFDDAEAAVVVTTDLVPDLPNACVVIADRWGDIQHVESVAIDEAVPRPSVSDILGWVRFVRIQCPECPP